MNIRDDFNIGSTFSDHLYYFPSIESLITSIFSTSTCKFFTDDNLLIKTINILKKIIKKIHSSDIQRNFKIKRNISQSGPIPPVSKNWN